MSALLWKVGTEERLNEHVRKQDLRFQAAMRAELVRMAQERGMRLVQPSAPVEKKRVRDIIVIPRSEPSAFPMTESQRIIKEVCAKHQVSRAEIIGKQKSARVSAARQELFYRLKTETTLSLPLIGRKVGGRDHTTVLYGIRCHEARMAGQSYSKVRPCHETRKAAREAAGQ